MAKTSKTIQLRVNIQDRDLERKARQAAGSEGTRRQRLAQLANRESARTDDAMSIINKFVEFAEVPERKVNALKWNNMTLQTFLHP